MEHLIISPAWLEEQGFMPAIKLSETTYMKKVGGFEIYVHQLWGRGEVGQIGEWDLSVRGFVGKSGDNYTPLKRKVVKYAKEVEALVNEYSA